MTNPITALQAVEDWWLTQADQSNGAPACIFMVREAIARNAAAKPNLPKIEADAMFYAAMSCLPAVTQAYRYFHAQGKTEEDFDRCAAEALTKAVRHAVQLSAREVQDPVWPYALDDADGVGPADAPEVECRFPETCTLRANKRGGCEFCNDESDSAGVTASDHAQAMDRFHEAITAVLGDLMTGDPSPESEQGRLLVRLADAVEAYEKVAYPMDAFGVAIPQTNESKDNT